MQKLPVAACWGWTVRASGNIPHNHDLRLQSRILVDMSAEFIESSTKKLLLILAESIEQLLALPPIVAREIGIGVRQTVDVMHTRKVEVIINRGTAEVAKSTPTTSHLLHNDRPTNAPERTIVATAGIPRQIHHMIDPDTIPVEEAVQAAAPLE